MSKAPKSPHRPRNQGVAPPPMTNAMGTTRDTAVPRVCMSPKVDRAVKPAGKKPTATMGWMKTATVSQESGTSPTRATVTPLRVSVTDRVRRTPKRSAAHPATRAKTGQAPRESPTSALAQPSPRPRSETR